VEINVSQCEATWIQLELSGDFSMKTRHSSHWIPFVAATVIYFGAAIPALAETASAAAASLPAGVVAKVNGVDIAQTQLDALVRASGQPDSAQVRQALKQELIVRELLRQQAEQARYGQKPEVQDMVNAVKANAETQFFLKDNVHPESVTDAKVKARYDEMVAALGKDEYRAGVITVPDAASAATVLSELKAGKAFDVLARQYSTAPSKANGGELPWVSFKLPLTEGKTQGLPLPIAQAITQLPVGGITHEPIAVGNVRVIVKLEAKRPTQVPGFDQTKDAIRQQLQTLAQQKATTEFVDGLIKGATITQ
jgi:peptidyl-prolyl cis-trans isomerase C